MPRELNILRGMEEEHKFAPAGHHSTRQTIHPGDAIVRRRTREVWVWTGENWKVYELTKVVTKEGDVRF